MVTFLTLFFWYVIVGKRYPEKILLSPYIHHNPNALYSATKSANNVHKHHHPFVDNKPFVIFVSSSTEHRIAKY